MEIPVIPAAIIVLLQIISPYIVALLGNFDWPAGGKKAAAVAISFILSLGLIVVALLTGWVPQDFSVLGIVTLVVLGLGIQQAAYSLIFKESADRVMEDKGLFATT